MIYIDNTSEFIICIQTIFRCFRYECPHKCIRTNVSVCIVTLLPPMYTLSLPVSLDDFLYLAALGAGIAVPCNHGNEALFIDNLQ